MTTKRNPLRKIGSAIGSYWQTTDRWLLLLCIALSASSVLFLYSLVQTNFTYMSRVYTQIGAVSVGVLAAIIISLIDYQALKKLWPIYVPAVVALVVLTFFVGSSRGADNQAWLKISIGSRELSLQPAEFLKISFISTFAMHLDNVRDKINKPMTVLLLCLHGGAHIGIIAAQGDDGSALIFVGIFLFMMFMAGLSWKYIIPAIGLIIPGIYVLWNYILADYQKTRFIVLWNPDFDRDAAFQQTWGLRALGVGGVQGKGLFADKHVYVPEIYNDFIFSFIGEALGFIGCLAVIVLLLIVCFKILYDSSLAIDMMGRMICVGVFAMIFTQTVINLGMVLNIMPVIGVTLPFLSAGGTSIVALYMGLGLVLSVYRHSKLSFFGKKT